MSDSESNFAALTELEQELTEVVLKPSQPPKDRLVLGFIWSEDGRKISTEHPAPA